MNALSLTIQSLSTALGTALKPVTIEDVCHGRTLTVLTVVYGMPDDLDATHAVRWLDRLINTQKSFRRVNSPHYCSLSLKNHVDYRNSIVTALHRRGLA